MKALIAKLIEQAKNTETHEVGQCIDRVFLTSGFINFSKTEMDEITKLVEDNNCSIQMIAEGTMSPKIIVKYHG